MINPGDMLDGRYRIESKIGQGGMSSVYRATDTKLGRNVAIKVLKEEFSTDEEFIRKFKHEAQSVASLVHPNIVAAYDAIDEGELHYIIMELVEGMSLKTYIQSKGMLSNQETIVIAMRTAEGISAAHKAGIIHRDIKPQNIIVSNNGSIKVADFGIAKAVTGETISTAVLGSAHYISPEQAKSGLSDERSDIYSLGITMYEMITGQLPFDGENTVSVVMAHINQAMVPPIVHNKEMYPALNDIILKCTKKNPKERYQNADELVEDLKRCLNEPEGHFVELFETVAKKPQEKKQGLPSDESSGIAALPEKKENDGKENPLVNKKVIYACIAMAFFAIAIVLLSHFEKKRSGREETEPETVTATETVPASETDIDIVIAGDQVSPNLIGMNVEEAKVLLNGEKLSLTVEREEYNDVYLAGRIIHQNPEEGESIRQGSSVYVTVSLGSKLDSVVNSLKGLTVEEAGKRLNEVGVKVSGLVKQFSEDVPDSYVVGYILDVTSGENQGAQNAAREPGDGSTEELPGEKITEGSFVKLIISAGKESEGTAMPQITGLSYQEALSVLEKNGLSGGSVNPQPEGGAVNGIVSWQSVSTGDLVKKGIAVDIRVDWDPQMPLETQPGQETYTYDGGEELLPEFFYGSIDESYQIGGADGPSPGEAVNIGMRLVQFVNDGYEYTVLSESRPYAKGTRIPVSYRNIRGAFGVDKGTIEVYDADTDMILAAYDISFHPVGN